MELKETPGRLLGSVQPMRVQKVAINKGVYENDRLLWGFDATSAITAVKGIPITFIERDHIQPNTHDWRTGEARSDYTPLLLSIRVRETWGEDAAGHQFQLLTFLSFFDVDPTSDEVEFFQGQGADEFVLANHLNYGRISRKVVEELTATLMSIEPTEDLRKVRFELGPKFQAASILLGLLLLANLLVTVL